MQEYQQHFFFALLLVCASQRCLRRLRDISEVAIISQTQKSKFHEILTLVPRPDHVLHFNVMCLLFLHCLIEFSYRKVRNGQNQKNSEG